MNNGNGDFVLFDPDTSTGDPYLELENPSAGDYLPTQKILQEGNVAGIPLTATDHQWSSLDPLYIQDWIMSFPPHVPDSFAPAATADNFSQWDTFLDPQSFGVDDMQHWDIGAPTPMDPLQELLTATSPPALTSDTSPTMESVFGSPHLTMDTDTADVDALFASLYQQQEESAMQQLEQQQGTLKQEPDQTPLIQPLEALHSQFTSWDSPITKLEPSTPALDRTPSILIQHTPDKGRDVQPLSPAPSTPVQSTPQRHLTAPQRRPSYSDTSSSSLPSPAPTSIDTFSPRIPSYDNESESIIDPDHIDLNAMYSNDITIPKLQQLFSSALPKHERTNNIIKLPEGRDKRFHCPWRQCPSSHARRYNLKTHYGEVHEGLKPFHCRWCDETFARKYDCNRHRINAHPDEEIKLPWYLQARLKSGGEVQSAAGPRWSSTRRGSSSKRRR
ncbi:hypothetical protein SpCBS45565_g00037 [Spizellomyces sp. 'palustris']|nr:hypothetical protein SpCBS45565_g00037 [Spizellomyces sp. 'palustris']